MNTQTTIEKPVDAIGKGLHLGKLSGVQLAPLSTNKGIQLSYKNVTVRIEPNLVCAGAHTSVVKVGKNYIHTIEHLMAALHGCGISNCQVLLSGAPEIPFLDGSSQQWVRLIESAKIIELKLPEYYVDYSEMFKFTFKDSIYHYYPSDDFIIDCIIDFPKSIIGYQHFIYKHSRFNFINEIARCRTFLMETSIGKPFNIDDVLCRLPGLDLENLNTQIIVCNHSEYLTKLFFENEAVRHKILDFIGDIRNIGFPVRGRFDLYKPSHQGNIAFMKELYLRWLSCNKRIIA